MDCYRFEKLPWTRLKCIVPILTPTPDTIPSTLLCSPFFLPHSPVLVGPSRGKGHSFLTRVAPIVAVARWEENLPFKRIFSGSSGGYLQLSLRLVLGGEKILGVGFCQDCLLIRENWGFTFSLLIKFFITNFFLFVVVIIKNKNLISLLSLQNNLFLQL